MDKRARLDFDGKERNKKGNVASENRGEKGEGRGAISARWPGYRT